MVVHLLAPSDKCQDCSHNTILTRNFCNGCSTKPTTIGTAHNNINRSVLLKIITERNQKASLLIWRDLLSTVLTTDTTCKLIRNDGGGAELKTSGPRIRNQKRITALLLSLDCKTKKKQIQQRSPKIRIRY